MPTGMKSQAIRTTFLEFFEAKEHKIVRSAPVIPAEDPTLLFTNAGMNQFKDVFLDKGSRPYSRAVDTQKCIRASGKHNDLEDVGRDTYHHTFFEMLGNWSFGDYYKKEAISWAWELMTDVWKLPRERLYATVYHDDEESLQIWKEATDIPHDHIMKFGDKDNFWEMGETGPCGPCSEIHIDLTPDMSGASLVNAGDHRVIELWNLVFIQYDRQLDGSLQPLPKKHVDTGMGFERITAVLQGKNSNYDTDIFKPLFDAITEMTGISYRASLDGEHDIAMRVIADHARTLAFAIADGAMPGNEGRGYVLRRILRRALRYARKLDCRKPMLYKLIGVISETMGDVFPELRKQCGTVQKIVRSEEESFLATLDRGMEIYGDIMAAMKTAGTTVMRGEDTFRLYDTYGFPVDLTRLMAEEEGCTIDEAGFDACMQEQKSRAREDRRQKHQVTEAEAAWHWLEEGASHSRFCGYDQLEADARILAFRPAAEELLLILDTTPFYAESGGQVGDQGVIENGEYRFHVTDTRKDGDMIIHIVDSIVNPTENTCIDPADIASGFSQQVHASVDRERRFDTERNHTATHLLHAALRKVLGEHVQQKGSMVTPERLRFDFSHFEKVSEKELAEVEAMVNREIREAHNLEKKADIPFEEAVDMGALAFFGDKYADRVRVVEVPGISIELCGGTHVDNIGRIGLFKITGESSVASGIRRIEAITGKAAEELLWNEFQELQQVRQLLKARSDEGVAVKVQELLEEKKSLAKEMQDMQLSVLLQQALQQLETAEEINGCKVLAMTFSDIDAGELRNLGQYIQDRMDDGVALLASSAGGKVALVSCVGQKALATRSLNAGALVKSAARAVQGGGGGKPAFATAGGKTPRASPRPWTSSAKTSQPRLQGKT